MGSPCNTFGNEPQRRYGRRARPRPPAPQWAPARSPTARATRRSGACSKARRPARSRATAYSDRGTARPPASTGAPAPINNEYGPKISATSTTAFGYTFVVKVQPAAVGTTVNLQVYDPIMLERRTDLRVPAGGEQLRYDWQRQLLGHRTPMPKNRYSKDGTSTSTFCTGDSYAGAGSGASTKHTMTTSFVLRQQVDSLDATAAAGAERHRRQPVHQAVRLVRHHVDGDQRRTSSSRRVAAPTTPTWPGCSTTGSPCAASPRPGQATTTSRSGPTSALGGSGTGLERSGNSAAAALTGDTTAGEGSNAFALRAVTAAGKEKEVAVAGYEHMPIFIERRHGLRDLQPDPGAARRRRRSPSRSATSTPVTRHRPAP